jgi:hypothetical protein
MEAKFIGAGRLLAFVWCCCAPAAWGGPAEAAGEGGLRAIKLSADGKRFVFAGSEEFFTPWGFNYVGARGATAEETWHEDWERIETDFRRMRELGANVVRWHLQLETYMQTADEVRADQLARLRRLVDLAAETGLYLDLTGLGCYRLSRVPAWFDKLGEQERWGVQARFWEAIAKTCAGHPAVFCYDLMNEPVIGEPKAGEHAWLTGELGGMYFVQRICNRPAGREKTQIAGAWVEKMTDAIRRHDRNHLVTIGVIPWAQFFPGAKPIFYSPAAARRLDFVSVHVYPESGKVDAALAALDSYDIGKPIVVEEVFTLRCTREELDEFIERSGDRVQGWMGHYLGKTIAEHRAAGDIQGAIAADFLEYWRDKGEELSRPARRQE